MIPYGTQDITEEDIEMVVQTLRSSHLTQGPKTEEFERKIAAYCGAKAAITTNSATSALHIACLALGLEEGDYLWTSPNSFVASANCGLYCNAKVDFVDIDPSSLNMCPRALEDKLEQAQRKNSLPKIIVVVHFAGQPCDMQPIHQLSQKYGFHIIEDASHAIGSSYQQYKTGSCQFSDITIFSFHPVKIITSGEGGCATTNNSGLAEKMELLRSHGITRDPKKLIQTNSAPWIYEQQTLGFNYRITDIHAALGISQLNRIDQYIKQRHDIAQIYEKKLAGLPLILPTQQNDRYSSLHLYPIQIDSNKTPVSRESLFEKLREAEIGVNVHYIPIHYQPFYKAMGFSKGDFPHAETYYSRAVTIPLHPKLTEGDINTVCNALGQHLS